MTAAVFVDSNVFLYAMDEGDAALSQRGWELQDRYRLSYWDSLILAAAKVASCGYLLTEDFEAGQNLDGVEVVNPFLRGPDDIL